jgi:hypothetical protein
MVTRQQLYRCAMAPLILAIAKIASVTETIVMMAQLSIATKSLTVSDSKGYLLDEDGFDYMKYSLLRDIKAQQRSLKWVHVFPLFLFICVEFLRHHSI